MNWPLFFGAVVTAYLGFFKHELILLMIALFVLGFMAGRTHQRELNKTICRDGEEEKGHG